MKNHHPTQGETEVQRNNLDILLKWLVKPTQLLPRFHIQQPLVTLSLLQDIPHSLLQDTPLSLLQDTPHSLLQDTPLSLLQDTPLSLLQDMLNNKDNLVIHLQGLGQIKGTTQLQAIIPRPDIHMYNSLWDI
jgi:hypothetical protein